MDERWQVPDWVGLGEEDIVGYLVEADDGTVGIMIPVERRSGAQITHPRRARPRNRGHAGGEVTGRRRAARGRARREDASSVRLRRRRGGAAPRPVRYGRSG